MIRTVWGNPEDRKGNKEKQDGFPWRALWLALLLVPALTFWGAYTEIAACGADLVALSLPVVAFAPFLVLLGANRLLRWWLPHGHRAILSTREILFVYTLHLCCLVVSGMGMMQYLVSFLAGAHQFGGGPIVTRMPAWVFPEPAVIPAFYAGQSSLLDPAVLAGWIRPVVVWSAFLLVFLAWMFAVAALLLRQWTERERLPFPLAVLPVEVATDAENSTRERGGRGTNGLFWAGCLLAVFVESLAALHYSIDPRVPYLPIKFNEPALQLALDIPPWNGAGGLALSFYPFVIGLGFLLPIDVSFSCWFFYLAAKAERVLAAALGYGAASANGGLGARIPYVAEQSAGGFLALALLALVPAWPSLKKAFQTPSSAPARLFLFTSVLLVCFGRVLGLDWYTAGMFFAVFLLLLIACARIRAEAGLPWSQGPNAHGLLLAFGGTNLFQSEGLTGMSVLRWHDLTFRSAALPFFLEALCIGGRAGISPRHLAKGILFLAPVAIVSSWVCLLGLYHHYGAATANVDSWRTDVARYNFEELATWLSTPLPPDPGAIVAVGIGGGITVGLSLLRLRFAGLPFHPLGFALGSGDWAMPLFWFPTLIGWLAKTLLLRYGGMALYRRALPLFLGLIVGDYISSAFWSLVYLGLGIPGYRLFPN